MGAILLRVIPGVILLLTSLITLATMGPEGPMVKLFGKTAVEVFSFFTFGAGIFFMVPRFWEWRQSAHDYEPGPIVRFFQGTWTAAGAAVILAGLAMLISTAFLVKQQEILMAVFGGMVGLTYMGGGVATIQPMWANMKHKKPKAKDTSTNKVLRIAKSLNGRVTATEIAASTTFSVHEAAGILNGLARDGFCEERVSEVGTSFYYFPEFANPNAKRDFLEDDEVTFDTASNTARSAQSAEAYAQAQEADRR